MSIAIATTNTIGNSIATVVTAKICGEFDEAMAEAVYAKMQRGDDSLQTPKTPSPWRIGPRAARVPTYTRSHEG